MNFKIVPGYLKPSELPNSLVLLGPPPEPGSAALAMDEEARKATIPLRGTGRWKLAITDADLAFPQAADNFSRAMGIKITETQTPRLYAMMQKVLSDFGLSTYGVKNKYNPVRPFVVHEEATCRADQEAILRGGTAPTLPAILLPGGDGRWFSHRSIPSVRTNCSGVASPSARDRVICNAHWQSDIDAGHIMAAATVARLQADPAFLADLKAAEAKVNAATTAPLTSMSDCAAEAAASAISFFAEGPAVETVALIRVSGPSA